MDDDILKSTPYGNYYVHRVPETTAIYYEDPTYGLLIYEQSKNNSCRKYGDFYLHSSESDYMDQFEEKYGTIVSNTGFSDRKYRGIESGDYDQDKRSHMPDRFRYACIQEGIFDEDGYVIPIINDL